MPRNINATAEGAAASPPLGYLPMDAARRVPKPGASPQGPPQAVYEDLGAVAPVDLPKLARHVQATAAALQPQGMYSTLDDGERGEGSSPRARPAYNVLLTSGQDHGNHDALGSTSRKNGPYDMLGKGKVQGNTPAVSQSVYTAVGAGAGGEAQMEMYDTLGGVGGVGGAVSGTGEADEQGRGYHVLGNGKRAAAAAPRAAPGYAALQTGRHVPDRCA